MKIIYHCYGGAHSSVTASAIHLGWLPTDRLPGKEELEKTPYFDRPMDGDHGNIRFMGKDEFDNDIHVVGRRNASRIFENMATGLVEIYKLPVEQFIFVDVMPYVNWKMVLGGFTSRRLGWTWFGRPVIMAGVRYSYWSIVSLVQQVRVCIASGQRGGSKLE